MVKARYGIPIAICLIIIVIVTAWASMSDQGQIDDPESDAPIVPEIPESPYPEGIVVDPENGTLSSDTDTTWHVFDLMAPYLIEGRFNFTDEIYDGYDVTGTEVALDPGIYRIGVKGESFEVIIGDSVDFTTSWTYDLAGTKHEVSVTYVMDLHGLNEQREMDRRFNDGTTIHKFSELPGLVTVDETIVALEGSLRKEFERIGGDVRDRQAYADFIASFSQLCIEYPDRVTGHGEDYGHYGKSEYWVRPLQTLYRQCGDCEDKSILLVSLYMAAGYQAAVGGKSGHVFAGVAIDGFIEVPEERLDALDPLRPYSLACSVPVPGYGTGELVDTVFYAVETIYKQMSVGYLTGGSAGFGSPTMYWGICGFYPVQGADPGIQGSL